MASIGLLSKDVITTNRIFSILEGRGHRVTLINSPIFDSGIFDTLIVDLNDSMALLVLKNHGHKSVAFAAANDDAKIKAAKSAGCDRVFKNGEFFKKILPKFKF